jgi:hypothetical protein
MSSSGWVEEDRSSRWTPCAMPAPMRMIAQRRINERHVLRVIYRQEGEDLVVITFYPGRRERYEAEL